MWETSLQIAMLVAGGLLGSAHCLGMCGGFVISLGAAATGWQHNLVRQLVYAAGRVAVYVFGGAVAGFTGWRFGLEAKSFVNAQAILCLLAGTLLILEGCWSLNWLPRLPLPTKACPIASFGSLLRDRSWRAALAAGVWNGFLPCGLVYAYLALAASTDSVVVGAGVMMLFGLGTIPALVLAGLGGGTLTVDVRRRLYRVAAVCLLVMGAWTIVRGVSFLLPASDKPPICPYCDVRP